MGRSKQKSGRQTQNRSYSSGLRIPRSLSPTPEPKEEFNETVTVLKYGEKDQNNIFRFQLLKLTTEEKKFGEPYPLGFPGTQYFIAVKELVIEWEDYQNEYCGYVECLSCECEIFKKMHSETSWAGGLGIPESRDKQLIRFVKPPGRRTTFINIENETFTGLDLVENDETYSYIDRKTGYKGAKYDIECAIKPMFDKNEVLPIKNSHITVKIMIGPVK